MLRFGAKYCRRINQEFGKLAIHGIAVFAASGDEGAVGDVDGDDEDCLENGNGTSVYTISYPASAPYVTAVGATMGCVACAFSAFKIGRTWTLYNRTPTQWLH